jgi:hypothetical protein
MTMAMTLCLAEKVLVQSFGTSELSARTRSTVLVLFHDQRSRSTSGLRASGVSTFLACLLPECFYPEFMICRWVSSHRSMDCESLRLFGLQKFQTFLLHFLPECFSPEVDDPSTCVFWNQWSICTLAFGPSGVLTQCNLSHLSPLECPVSGLHDLSPRGEILEADTWPNQVGDMCHVLTDFSILQMLKTY